MYCVPPGSSRGFRWVCIGLAAIVALVATLDTADARSKRKRAPAKKAQQYNPPTAAIVVDAKTGSTLHASNADARRYPASLTKVMTLYMLFEQLEAGTLKLNSPIEFSAAAAARPPTKLGLRPGQSITVEDAIKSLVTKSANDVATAVAETLGGSEAAFARQMTRKAHALGMTRTVYRNASGLPDSEQVTTARDQALLGIAIRERFPKYYKYFSTSRFVFRGSAMRNHNRLLGQVEGVDGIKTGYTRASGFNLLTSMQQGERRVVAVVLGGRSSRQRDARMRQLVQTHIASASTRRPYTKVAEAPIPTPAPRSTESKSAEPSTPQQLASALSRAVKLPALPQARPADAEAGVAETQVGSSEPIRPIQVRTLSVTLVPPRPPTPTPVHTASVAARAAPEPQSAPTAATSPSSAAESASARTAARGGWAIQVGAFEEESEAKQRLTAAQNKAARLLGNADPYTERTVRGDKTFYRARFAGFDREQARAACRYLKRNDIVCLPLRM
jgi:D-alanyl-D-alanine carboxypeptidase